MTEPTWTYKGRMITEISDMPEGTYGFIYQITHTPTNKKYIGKKVMYFTRKVKLTKKEIAEQTGPGRKPTTKLVTKESDPMVFESIKDRIKYFTPAFHSITPEGLNARLTFLQQCMRPGQTIPVIGPDGKPKYNDAQNTAFGAPPVLVLRIGDFYHTKIIPNTLGIQYDPLVFDINPEGTPFGTTCV